MNKKTITLLAVIAVVVLVTIIIFSLKSSNPETPNQEKAANQNQVDNPNQPVPATVDETGAPLSGNPVNLSTTSALVAAALSSMPGSPEAPKQELVETSDIPKSAVKLTVSDDGFTPNKFTIKSGQEVSLALTATGSSTHVFLFPTAALMGLQTVISGGETKMITFTAPSVGTYSFRDDIPNFRKNTGDMIVE